MFAPFIGVDTRTMKRKLLSLTLGLTAISSLFLVAAPSAGAAVTTSVGVTRSQGISWVEADSSGAVSAFEIKIMAPGSGQGRRLWQTCRFTGTDAGIYRCGIDTTDGSPALQREGTWAAKVFSGGVRVARTTFTL